MNIRPLAQLLQHLSIWERIRLIFAAEGRGDKAESERLTESSPRRYWCYSEHLLAEQALNVLSLTYITEQLDAAANYFFGMWLSQDDDPESSDLLFAAEASAYFFAANAEAWRRFCNELGLDANAVTAANYRGWLLQHCEEQMAGKAPSAEALLARWRKRGGDVPTLITAEKLLVNWRHALKSATTHAPPEFVTESA